MGVVEPALFLLVKLCFISFALAVSRSTGFNISSSPITSTEITPIPGTNGPVDDKSFGSNAPGPVSQPIVTGPVSHPTLALPPLLSTPAPQTINAFVPSLPPNSSTTLPPYYATPPPTTFQDHVPSIPPVVNTSVPITPSRSPIVPSLTPINSTPSPPLYAVPSLPSNSSTALPPYYATPPPTTSQDHVPSIPPVVNTSVPITPSRSPMVPSLTPINSTPSPPLYAVPSLPSNSSTALPPYYATPPPSTSQDHVPSIPPVVNTSVPITPSRSPMVPSLSPINSTPSPPLYAVPSLPSNSSTALPPYYATPPPSTSQDHVPSIPPVVNTSVPITPSRSPIVPSLSPINSTPLRPHNAVSPSTNADHLPSITPTAPQEKEPIVKSPISMPIAPVPAAPPLRNTPQVATAIPPSTQKISPSSSYHENSTHERVAPAEPITPVYDAPSPSVSVQNPPLVSNNHQHISPSVLPVAPPKSEMPKNSSIGPAIPGIPPSMLPDHDVSPTSLPPVGMFRKNDGVPIAAPSFEIPKPTTSVAHSPTNADARHSNRAPPSPALSPKSPPMQEYHPSASSPLSAFYKHHHARNKTASPAPSLTFPTSSPAPKQLGPIIPEPSRSSRRRHYAPPPLNHVSPSKSPSKIPRVPLVPPLALPPPPPNEDCSSTICTEPYTNTPPGSPCGCVMPIQVGLRLTVDLYTFFPLVSELAWETAASVFIKQSQVRIIGANEANQQPDKTVVLVDLVPLGDKFDNTTAFFIFERFWNKQVAIKPSFFGDYEVLYVRYPGLPSSPPASDLSLPDSGPYSGVDSNLRPKKPLGVNVHKRRHKKRFSGGVIAIIALSSFAAVILCSATAWFLLFKHRNKVCQPASTPRDLLSSIATKQSGTNYAGSLMESRHSSACLSFGSSIPPYKGSAKTFSSNDIERATGHFDASRILGEGGFGLVYSGVLEDGTKIAVKILKRDDQQGGREFLAEVEMLSRLHHRNLVKLIGICTEEHTRCLVYELIPNGSVESHLHGIHKQLAPLDWGARMKIALGAARGLAYLHEDSSPRVIHRDFKSSNILLEDDFTPKVSDFGLARTALDEENRHISTRVMGTFGYVAPEYAMTGHLLVKSDVYSYGVVLLELLTGRKPVDMSQPPGQENLVTWARPFLSSKEGLERIIDPSLRPDVPFESVAKVAAIASMCVQPEVSHRPFMGEVVQALKLICSEHEEASEVGSRRSSQEEISIDIAAGASTTSGQYPDPLQSQYSVPSYYESEPDNERGLSPSDVFNTSTRLGREHSRSFRRHSSSGPLRDARGRQFWQRVRRLSGGSVSENGVMLRLWPGSY